MGVVKAETVQRVLSREEGPSGGDGGDEAGEHPRLTRAMRFIRDRGFVTRREYARRMQVSPRTALRDLADLVGRGILRRAGSGPGVRYLPVEEGG
ncbi:MAG: DeoR family transcriptional regulator [Candidatus Eisenbacteria bacterium]|nr:DeoR family transcriptional regulator [Candidatus Latescibacterota bacterium]MBD3336674.1 DeoR family transcriptional regulator [Candidatus Eisenbacteria bacterium]